MNLSLSPLLSAAGTVKYVKDIICEMKAHIRRIAAIRHYLWMFGKFPTPSCIHYSTETLSSESKEEGFPQDLIKLMLNTEDV